MKTKGLKVAGLEFRSNEGLGFLSFYSFPKTFVEVLDPRWRISSIFLSKIIDVSLISLSIRRKDEKVEASMDEVLEVEEEQLQSSFRYEVVAFR